MIVKPKSKLELINTVLRQLEYAYAEGQNDAMHGDIRIKRVTDSTITFIKSPWDEADTGAKYNQWKGREIKITNRDSLE